MNEYYSAFKNRNPSCGIIWMNLKDIMLSGISQHRKENSVLTQLYVESAKSKLIKQIRISLSGTCCGDNRC